MGVMARRRSERGEFTSFVRDGLGQGMTFTRPEKVYLDACHPSDGLHTGPLTTLDGLVTALSEQRGWVDVTAPADISIDGYASKTFRRSAPTDLSECTGDLRKLTSGDRPERVDVGAEDSQG